MRVSDQHDQHHQTTSRLSKPLIGMQGLDQIPLRRWKGLPLFAPSHKQKLQDDSVGLQTRIPEAQTTAGSTLAIFKHLMSATPVMVSSLLHSCYGMLIWRLYWQVSHLATTIMVGDKFASNGWLTLLFGNNNTNSFA